jgi:hypothetical protein
MGVYSIAAGGGLTRPRTIYPNMGINSPYIYGAIVPIASATANGGTSSIGFLTIPQIYQDLRIIISGNATSGSNNSWVTFNADFSSNSASRSRLIGNGTSASSDRRINDSVVYLNNPLTNSSTIQATWTIDILNYRSTTFKTILWRFAQDLNGSGTTEFGAGLKQVTATVSQIDINTGSANWAAGSTFTLYGIRAANS